MKKIGTRYGRSGLLLLLLLLTAWFTPSEARMELVTVPNRDSVQLTIYNSADLTLVKETRVLTFRKGVNKLEFSWANTLIDPTSVEFRALSHADEIEVADVSFPPRVTNTLEWRIQSEMAGEAEVEIRYFTSGISWNADYVAEADHNERLMALAGNVRVTNNSGEDYENAQVRLVVGVIHLVENIADLARQGRPGPLPQVPRGETEQLREAGKELLMAKRSLALADMAMAGRRRAEIVKEGMSEYFLYTVEGRDTIPNGWAKRLPSFEAKEVPVASYYKYERERWGGQAVRFYRFKNDEKSKLGKEPLPNGQVMAFRVEAQDQWLAFVGQASAKYVPVNEDVELELGADAEVLVKPKLMNWQKTDLRFNRNGQVDGWTVQEQWQIEVQNSKDIPVTVDVRRNFSGDWTLASETAHQTVDAGKVKFVLPVPPHQKQTVEYTVTTRYGTNVSR